MHKRNKCKKNFIYLDLIFGKKKIKDVKKNIMKIKMILN